MVGLILFGIYALSAIGMWLYIHLSHGPNGIYSHADVDRRDVFMTLCPFLNTIGAVLWFEWPLYRSDSDHIKKFFRIK